MTHQMRYQQMLKMAQMEAQQSYEARVYQQKYLQTQAKQLLSYVGTLEKFLTAFLDDLEGGTTDSDRDLTLMRMQIDIAKAKASQRASADTRKIQISKAAEAEFDIPRTQVQAIQTSGAAIEKRGRLAGTDAAALAIVESELAKIVVDNAGSGSAVNAAQNFMSSTEQAFDRAGQPGYFTNNSDQIEEKVKAHFSTEIYTPKAVSKPPSNLELDIPDAKSAQKKKELRKHGGAHTGGLSTAMNKVDTLRTGGATPKEVDKAKLEAFAGMQGHEDYLTLVTELNKDGTIDEEDWALFEDRITTDEADASNPADKPEILKQYERMVSEGWAEDLDLPRSQALLYDPTFMRKGAAIGQTRKQLETLRTKASTPPRPPSYEAIRQRGRELYDPIRMKGSPHAGQQFTVKGSDGRPITINVADIDAMQDEFESFLSNNPLVKQDFGLIQKAYELAPGISAPGKKVKKTSPQYIGYTLHQQWKAGTVKSADEVYKIASQVAGSDDQLRNNIVTHFHAYNLQPTFNQYKGVDMQPSSRRLADEFMEAFDEESATEGKAIIQGEEEAPTEEEISQETAKHEVPVLAGKDKQDNWIIEYVKPPPGFEKLWLYEHHLNAYNRDKKPLSKDLGENLKTMEKEAEVHEKPKPEDVVVDVIGPQIPVGQQFWQEYKPSGKPTDPKFYAYEITGYDGTVPQWTFVSKKGTKDPSKMTSSMITEANKAYAAALKELE